METKLFYENAYKREFTAKIVTQQQDEKKRWYVVLDKTAFYPTGGSQPHDIGTLAEVNVVDVENVEGEIRHYLKSPIVDHQEVIQGVLDWDRRFDHMQQHAGQHILSAAFAEMFGFETISFHLGKEVLTIDLNTSNISEEELKAAEALANQVILENHKIETLWISKDDLNLYPLRKQPSVTENIRLVVIPDFDYNACGGTHPNSSAEVRAVKIINWERHKKKVRIHFICGNRVLTQFNEKTKILFELTDLLNVPEQKMTTAVKRLLQKEKELEQAFEKLKEEQLTSEAKQLLHSNDTIVSRVYYERPIKELQKLAQMITTISEQTCVVFVAQNEKRLQVIGAKGPASEAKCKQVILESLKAINGKGGGSEELVQGGGDVRMSAEHFLEEIVSKI
ncbi:DHHA1 domain-containing protein [Halalkalibacter kiskunsagensis]|uniref:DHHA1 domain-containing protein n=1 Tax=Halalkalibacter kiskunsagensis TaxID=1548599 RepID=A0ABV6KHN0_9BACI